METAIVWALKETNAEKFVRLEVMDITVNLNVTVRIQIVIMYLESVKKSVRMGFTNVPTLVSNVSVKMEDLVMQMGIVTAQMDLMELFVKISVNRINLETSVMVEIVIT
jgi:hypothetical protein